MISKTFKGGMWISSTLFNSKVFRYVKKRGVWYYRILLSEQFSNVVTDIYDMNILEKKLNKLNKHSSLKKKVFSVDEKGTIFDDSTGVIYGSYDQEIGNKFEENPEEDGVEEPFDPNLQYKGM
tara:strand:+ start:136 stop:504 length:369 start_codon:yes stop_codon:yes gene_type:complete